MKGSDESGRDVIDSRQGAMQDMRNPGKVAKLTEGSACPTSITDVETSALQDSSNMDVVAVENSACSQQVVEVTKEQEEIDAEDDGNQPRGDEQAPKLDGGAKIEQQKPAKTGKGTAEVMLDDEDLYLESFQEVRNSIDLEKLKDFALSLRKNQSPGSDQLLDCKVCARPKNGSYNLVYIIAFSDGVQWCARVPGYGKQPTKHLREKMDIEYSTMRYIRRWTTFPAPTVHYWTTGAAEIGVAFALLSFMHGKPLSELWFEREIFGEVKRLATLSSIAKQMQKLYLLQFPKTGMLRCDSDKDKTFEVSHALDYHDDGLCLWAGVIKRGQIESFQEWLEDSLKRLEEYDPNGGEIRSPHGALRILAKSVPKYMQRVPLTLSLADLDLQNVFVDPESGEVTGFIDFDGVAVQPAHIGAAAHPLWLIRNFNPAEYVYAAGMLYEDSPEDLARYRKHYADCWKSFDVSHLGLSYDSRWTSQSHVVKTIWSAIVAHHDREGMTYMLIDHAYANAFNLGVEELARLWDSDWDNYEPVRLELAISKGLWSQRASRASMIVAARDICRKVSSVVSETKKYLGVVGYLLFGVPPTPYPRRR